MKLKKVVIVLNIKTEDGKYRFYALKEPYKRIVNQSSVNLEIHSGDSN